MRNVTELGLLPEIECRVRSSRMSICAVLRSGVPGAASSAEASGAVSQVQSGYAIGAEKIWDTRDHCQLVPREQLFERRVEGSR